MPIQSIQNKRRLPRVGKIRLGERKQGANSNYPTMVDHFILKDAPGVAEVYGDDPTEIDVILPHNSLDVFAPTALKKYSASIKNADGSVKYGKLQCTGNGVNPDTGEPGVAQWFEKQVHGQSVPTRPCLERSCPDWDKCKPSMNLYVILPKVTWFGVFQIDTTSWNTIGQIVNFLEWVKTLNGGKLLGYPCKIARVPTTINIPGKDGKTAQKVVPLLNILPNEDFSLQDPQVQARLESIRTGSAVFLPADSEAGFLGPMEDHTPLIGEHEAMTIEVSKAKVATAEDLLKDPEISAGFDRLEQAVGKKFTDKTRLIAIRKVEHEPDVKAAVMESIGKALENAMHKQPPKAAQSIAEAEGIM